MSESLSNNVWQGVAAIAAVLSLIAYTYVERNRLPKALWSGGGVIIVGLAALALLILAMRGAAFVSIVTTSFVGLPWGAALAGGVTSLVILSIFASVGLLYIPKRAAARLAFILTMVVLVTVAGVFYGYEVGSSVSDVNLAAWLIYLGGGLTFLGLGSATVALGLSDLLGEPRTAK